ncbi:MAG TPA: hypothetical protein VFV44_04315 [Nitrospiraceae bacterium]|nr:hypothetical protein [Nitrospiraceae bacterium]
MWFSIIPVKGTGHQLNQGVLDKLCGHLHATRSDRAVLERLRRIVEIRQWVAKGTTH